MPDVNEEATRRREEEEQKTVKTLQLMAEIVNGFSTKYEHRTFLLMVTTTRERGGRGGESAVYSLMHC